MIIDHTVPGLTAFRGDPDFLVSTMWQGDRVSASAAPSFLGGRMLAFETPEEPPVGEE